MTDTKRISYFDIAKGIGMICVILGHMGIVKINTIVFSFHMPLFFLISGYFAKRKNSMPFILKQAKNLLVPYVFTGLCVVAFALFNNLRHGSYSRVLPDISSWIYAILYGSGNDYSTPFYIKSIGAIWFLLALFFASIIYNYIIEKKYCWLYVCLIFILGYITSKFVYLPWSIQSAMVALVFIHIGFIISKKEFIKFDSFLAFFLSAGIWWICVLLDKGRFYMVRNYFTNIPIDILGGVMGSYIVIFISKQLDKIKIVSKGLQTFGKYSLIVLCFHLIELNTFPWQGILNVLKVYNPNIRFILLFTMKLIWSIMGITMVLNIPGLRKVFNIKEKAIR